MKHLILLLPITIIWILFFIVKNRKIKPDKKVYFVLIFAATSAYNLFYFV